MWNHGLRNALLPVVTASALYIGLVVGGAIQVETVFSWPGMGELTYDAVLRRDYPVLEACFLLFAITVIVANFISDLLYRISTHGCGRPDVGHRADHPAGGERRAATRSAAPSERCGRTARAGSVC